MAFGAGEGDVKEAFFLFEFTVAFGVVAGEFVGGETGDEDGVEFEAFGLVDGEDGDAVVVRCEKVEIPSKCDPVGEFSQHVWRRAGGIVVIGEEFFKAFEIREAWRFGLVMGVQAGFIEYALAERGGTERGGKLAPGVELCGDGVEGLAKAIDEFLPGVGACGERGGKML